jgi:cystathionine gamma-lyase
MENSHYTSALPEKN